MKGKPVTVLESAACANDPQGTTELRTEFELSDGTGDPVVVSHLGAWKCKKQGKKLKAAKT